MTAKDLKKLKTLPRDIRVLKSELQEQQEILSSFLVTDTVSGSSKFLPFGKHTITIQGITDTQEYIEAETKVRYVESQLCYAQKQYQRLKNFVENISNPEIKQLCSLYYEKCKTWQQIAFLYGWKDESTPREKVKNFLENPENPDFGVLKLK